MTERINLIEAVLPKAVHSRMTHHLVVSTNLLTTNEDSVKSFTTTSESTTYPYPIFEGIRDFTLDPGLKRVHRKTHYINQLSRLKTRYLSDKKNKSVRKNENKGIYSDKVIKYAHLLDSDPLPFFSGTIDWYYSGGSLCHINDVDGEHLAYSTGPQSNILGISPLTHKKGFISIKNDETISIPLNNEESIYEIQHSPPRHKLIGCRQENNISIIYNRHKKKEAGSLINLVNFKSKIHPFISFSFEKHRLNCISTSDVSGLVKIFDIEHSYKKPIIENKLPNSVEGFTWNRFKNLEHDLYLFGIKSNVGLFDSRTSNEFALNYFLDKFLSSCEKICSIESQHDASQIIASTNHNTFLLDLRFHKDTMYSMTPISRWTHQLQYPPIFMKHCDGIVAMSSPCYDDARLIETHDVGKRYIVPKTISETNAKSRLTGSILNPEGQLRERTKLCTAGLEILKFGKKTIIALQNTGGDIFCQHMVDKADDCSQFGTILERMSNWESNLKGKSKPTVSVTDVANFESITRIISCKKFSASLKDEMDEPVKEARRPKWKRPLSVLSGYKDALAADMMSIWDFENTDVTDNLLPKDDNNDGAPNLLDNWLFNVVVHDKIKIEDEAVENTEMFNNSQFAAIEKRVAPKKVVKKRTNQGF